MPVQYIPLHGGALVGAVCKAASQDVHMSSKSWFDQCGLGGRVGFGRVWEQIKSIPSMAAKALVLTTPLGMYTVISSLWTKKDPAKALDQTARAQATTSVTNLQQWKKRYDAAVALLQGFLAWLDHESEMIGLGTKSMVCLPWQWKVHQICQFISEFGSNVVTLDGIAGAANKSAQVARAIANFNRESKITEELARLSLTERLGAASAALKTANEYKTFLRAGDVNVTTRVDAISGETRYFLEEHATVHGKRVSERTEIPRDAKTGAFDSNTIPGKKLASAVAGAANGKFMVFGDVMDLGKTNYFKGGTQAGDKYLSHIAAALRNSMRNGDLIFKNGGDELVVILQSHDPAAVIAFQKRVQSAIANDKVLQQLFRDERVAAARAIPRGRDTPTPQQIAALQEMARTRPGLAMGSARIHPASPQQAWSTALQRAEEQAAKIKATTKAARGADITKYGSAVAPSETRSIFDAPIEILAPLE